MTSMATWTKDSQKDLFAGHPWLLQLRGRKACRPPRLATAAVVSKKQQKCSGWLDEKTELDSSVYQAVRSETQARLQECAYIARTASIDLYHNRSSSDAKTCFLDLHGGHLHVMKRVGYINQILSLGTADSSAMPKYRVRVKTKNCDITYMWAPLSRRLVQEMRGSLSKLESQHSVLLSGKPIWNETSTSSTSSRRDLGLDLGLYYQRATKCDFPAPSASVL